MIPKLIDLKHINNHYFYLTDCNVIGTAFNVNLIDLEVDNIEEIELKLSDFIRNLEPNLNLVLISNSDKRNSFNFNTTRSEFINNLPTIENNLTLAIEEKLGFNITSVFNLFKRSNIIEDSYKRLFRKIDIHALKQIFNNFSPLSSFDIKEYFNYNNEISLTPYGLINGYENIGILKLIDLSTNSINISQLALIRENLPAPFELVFKTTKVSQLKSQSLLKRKSKQDESSFDLSSQKRYQENQELLSNVELDGETLHQFEFHVVIRRLTEEELRLDLGFIKNSFERLGQFNIEVTGAFISFSSSRLGSLFHEPKLEKNTTLPSFTPIFSRSDSTQTLPNNGSLLFHRADYSLTHFYPFNKNYTSYSTIVIGNTGFGKSLWANAFLKSVLNEENAQAILVDVKSSHLRTCRLLNGNIKQIDSTTPTGINPFSILKKDKSKDVLEVILGFLTQLCLDENEINLPISIQVSLEKALIEYSKNELLNPDLEDFLSKTTTFPRKEYLERFRKDGLFGNIFHESAQNSNENKLVYYDFKNLQSASNKAISTGVMAAVMSDFYLRVLSKPKNDKMYFICDETPFFIKNCFHMFRLLIKNVRKLNISLVLLAQKHDDLIHNNDLSLIENSAIKILFTKDGNSEEFMSRFGLNNDQISILEYFSTKKDNFSKFLIKDEIGTRIGLLRLTPEEYFFSTTSGGEVEKIEQAQKIAPLLSTEEIVKIFAELKMKEVGLI